VTGRLLSGPKEHDMSDDENPWKTLSTRVEFENPWFRVTTHDTIAPDGSRPRYGKISFKNRAVAILPLDEDDHTWLVGQWRFPLGEYSWELPMGGSPLAVDPLESARRELQEETGLSADRWTCILRVHTSNSVTDEEGLVYLAEGLTAGTPSFDETEQLDIRRLPLAEAVAMAMDGRITDAISVAGLLAFARRRARTT
jgi:8-oxo-dGTP pyrophosphatase MutT (NUDIX family)